MSDYMNLTAVQKLRRAQDRLPPPCRDALDAVGATVLFLDREERLSRILQAAEDLVANHSLPFELDGEITMARAFLLATSDDIEGEIKDALRAVAPSVKRDIRARVLEWANPPEEGPTMNEFLWLDPREWHMDEFLSGLGKASDTARRAALGFVAFYLEAQVRGIARVATELAVDASSSEAVLREEPHVRSRMKRRP